MTVPGLGDGQRGFLAGGGQRVGLTSSGVIERLAGLRVELDGPDLAGLRVELAKVPPRISTSPPDGIGEVAPSASLRRRVEIA